MNLDKPSEGERKDELLHRLKALCPMREQRIDAGGQTFRLWSACDLDPLLDSLSNKPPDDPEVVDERLPYWAEVWPSARLLAEAVMSLPLPTRSGPWLELGCGPGLAGIAASKRGVPGIWSDYMKEALWLAELNAINAGQENPGVLQLDWREPPGDLRVPWILASDVAYEERNFPPLLDSFEALLLPGGEIWFAEPGRPVARIFMAELAEAAWERHAILQEARITVWRLRRAKAD